MVIGILACDSVLLEYQPRFSDYPQMIKSLLTSTGRVVDFVVYDVTQQQYPAGIDECDAYVTTGSKASVYDDLPWIHHLQKFIQQLHSARKPLIGICFGHQLVAQALGGETRRSERGWGVGVQTADIYRHEPWQLPHRETLALLASHQDQVVTPPLDAEVVAGSAFCPYSMLRVGEHILTFQSHPEFNKAYAETMMRHRAERLGPAVLAQGLASLANPVDENIAAQWIWLFLERALHKPAGAHAG